MTRIRPADRGGHLCDDGRRCQCCVPSVARGAYGGATEESPLRRERYPYRGSGIPHIPEDYDKLDVEQRWATRGATVLRLPMVYGPHDPQRREDVVLRRLRAGRRRIPIGTGNLLWTRGHVEDLATGVLAALDNRAADGSTFNLGETLTWPISSWFDQTVTAAGADVELVRVPDHALPPDLALTAAPAQHLLVSTARAQAGLGWAPGEPADRVAHSVRWHLAHPPATQWTDEDTARSVSHRGQGLADPCRPELITEGQAPEIIVFSLEATGRPSWGAGPAKRRRRVRALAGRRGGRLRPPWPGTAALGERHGIR